MRASLILRSGKVLGRTVKGGVLLGAVLALRRQARILDIAQGRLVSGLDERLRETAAGTETTLVAKINVLRVLRVRLLPKIQQAVAKKDITFKQDAKLTVI